MNSVPGDGEPLEHLERLPRIDELLRGDWVAVGVLVGVPQARLLLERIAQLLNAVPGREPEHLACGVRGQRRRGHARHARQGEEEQGCPAGAMHGVRVVAVRMCVAVGLEGGGGFIVFGEVYCLRGLCPVGTPSVAIVWMQF